MNTAFEVNLNYEKIGGLVWYAECMERAIQEIRSFAPPASDIRFHHALFAVNLMSLLERAAELFGDGVWLRWNDSLDGHGGLSGDNNAGYVRELRNAVVHRGLDIAASGVVISNHVRAVAPAEMFDRLGRRGPFKAFGTTLFEIFEVCRAAVGPIVLTAAKPLLETIEQVSSEELRINYLNDIEASTIMPEWAKEMTRANVGRVPFEEVRTLQGDKLRSLLS